MTSRLSWQFFTVWWIFNSCVLPAGGLWAVNKQHSSLLLFRVLFFFFFSHTDAVVYLSNSDTLYWWWQIQPHHDEYCHPSYPVNYSSLSFLALMCHGHLKPGLILQNSAEAALKSAKGRSDYQTQVFLSFSIKGGFLQLPIKCCLLCTSCVKAFKWWALLKPQLSPPSPIYTISSLFRLSTTPTSITSSPQLSISTGKKINQKKQLFASFQSDDFRSGQCLPLAFSLAPLALHL